MTARPPVADWATDWDHLDPAWTIDPYGIWDGLRQRCPVAHTDRYKGVYFPTRYQDIRDIAYDYEHFSSRRVVVRESDYRVNSPPITSDPPDHRPMRMALIPPFTPQAVAKLEAKARVVCNELIDRFAAGGVCDGAVDYAQNIPVLIITHMPGIPAEHGDQFREWITMALQTGVTDERALRQAEEAIAAYFEVQIKARRENPGEDLVSFLIAARSPDGEPFSDRQVLGALRLLLVAGIDTTWSAIGSSLWHLATHEQDRARLVAEPELIPTAVEEFLRAYAPVTMAREIARTTDVGGCPMRQGQMVLLSFPAANRDPEKFPDADKVLIDRKHNPHAAFGLGIHRCIGSNLARMEMVVALQEWLKRIPAFSLDRSKPTTWSQGTVRGPRNLTGNVEPLRMRQRNLRERPAMGVSFQRSHDITIETPPSAVYDYVCNPNSWPEWLAASHHIDGEDRPLLRGETFREQWHIKRGEVRLAWTVTESDPPNAWTVEADTDFIGKIVIRYTFEAVAGGTKYTRTLRNPDRPSEPSPEQIARMDEEAMIGLQNIKRNVEKRFAKAGQA